MYMCTLYKHDKKTTESPRPTVHGSVAIHKNNYSDIFRASA